MLFRLAIAGDLPQNGAVLEKVDKLLEQLQSCLYNGKESNQVQMIVSPSYTANSWKGKLHEEGRAMCGYSLWGDRSWDDVCAQVVREDTPLRNVLGEAICDKADLILMVWNEDVRDLFGASWELIQLAHSRKTPCVWISAQTGQIYWSQESYYEKYSTIRLELLCAGVHMVDVAPAQVADTRIPLLSLGKWLRKRYMRKYSALAGKVDPEKDRLMRDDFTLETEQVSGESVRKSLLKHFHIFDQSAIELNSRYQAVLYWRALMPLITSVFLGIGFYAENMLGIFPGPKALWAYVAGLGFFIHGMLNLYVYILSRSETIKSWHRGFLDDRYIAEMIRVLIHFVPYGINLNLRKLSGGNQRIYAMVRRMTEEAEPQTQEISKKSVDSLLTHLEEMLEDQIAYHTFSARRYSGIVETLDKWYRVMFGAGFCVVILRAVLQLVWRVFPLAQISLNGIALSSFASSFANMLAMMIPSWASYFASKSSQCNFRYNMENHQRMTSRLTEVMDRIHAMREAVREVPIEALDTLGEELAEVMLLDDTSAWHRQYMGATIKVL